VVYGYRDGGMMAVVWRDGGEDCDEDEDGRDTCETPVASRRRVSFRRDDDITFKSL